MIRIGINGFGRIGRMVSRKILRTEGVELAAIHDVHDVQVMAHLFKYDSVHGAFSGSVRCDGEKFILDGCSVQYNGEKSLPENFWISNKVDVVLECTGKFKTQEGASQHLAAGARKVIITAATSDENIPMVVLGVNESVLEGDHDIVSNASCTTNNAAPMLQLIDELAGIESCYITTVHSYTGDQRLIDAPHVDLRRARGALSSIIPTTTGAAKALTRIFPSLSEVIGGAGIRVPVPDGSLTDMTCIVREDITVREVNEAFRKASETRYKGLLQYTEEPIVSVDVLGSEYSCIFDAQLTSVIGKMVKVVGWYDNETGYSARLVELAKRIG